MAASVHFISPRVSGSPPTTTKKHQGLMTEGGRNRSPQGGVCVGRVKAFSPFVVFLLTS